MPKPHMESAGERLLFHAYEARLAKLDQLIDATHAMMDVSQAALDEMTRAMFQLETRLDLLDEWTRLRFEDLSRER